MRHALLLEVAAWPWLERLSAAAGRRLTLGDVPGRAWDRIAHDGFEHLFLMGVWTRSAIGRQLARTDLALAAEYDRALPGWREDDVPGSPYCIQDYVPDPRMGGWAGLDAARQALASRGIRLILDFVPNHTAFDHPWVARHPGRYVLGTDAEAALAPGDFRRVESIDGPVHVACARDPYFPPWRDVAQLNYFNPETREAMRGVLARLAAHCDGVRCDMAMLPLNDVFEGTWGRLLGTAWPRPAEEFWPRATSEVRTLQYLAEVYWEMEETLLAQGFDAACDKRLLDALREPDAPVRVRRLLAGDRPPRERMARFLENHDEARSAAWASSRLPAAAALAVTLPGIGYLFDGQLEGRRIRTPVQLGRWAEEPVDPAIRDLYDRVLRFARERIVEGAAWRLLDVAGAGDDSFPGVAAWCWAASPEAALIVVNLSDAPAQAHVDVLPGLPAGDAFDLDDALGDGRYHRRREDLAGRGLYVRLDGGGAHLFTVRAAPLRAA